MYPTPTEYPQFFTATILEWKKLLKPDTYKHILVESLRFLVADQRVIIYAFVIMDNHIHLIWQMKGGYPAQSVQRDFLKYTAQKLKKDLLQHHPAVLPHFKVTTTDRQYQFWKRNALSIELRTPAVFEQKLCYLHENPMRAGLCKWPEDYKYSSALFYHTGRNNWGFLTHYTD